MATIQLIEGLTMLDVQGKIEFDPSIERLREITKALTLITIETRRDQSFEAFFAVLKEQSRELTSLETVICDSSLEIIDGFMNAIEDCPSLQFIFFTSRDQSAREAPRSVVEVSLHHPKLEELSLRRFVFSESNVQRFCDSMCQRQGPIGELSLECRQPHGYNAINLLINALPLMRLRGLSIDLPNEPSQICGLLDGLPLCQEMKLFDLRSRESISILVH